MLTEQILVLWKAGQKNYLSKINIIRWSFEFKILVKANKNSDTIFWGISNHPAFWNFGSLKYCCVMLEPSSNEITSNI